MNNMTIEFQVENQILSRTDSQRIVEDSINYLYAHFTFSEDWANTTKAIIVENKKVDLKYKVYLNEQDTCKIPNAIVDYDGFSIIVVGENANNYVTITTSLLFVSVLMSNFTPTGEADLKYVTSDTLDVQKDGDIVNIEIPNIYFKDVDFNNNILKFFGRDNELLGQVEFDYGRIHNITIEIDNTNYILTLNAYDKTNTLLFTRSADFNIEGMLIKSASYDSATQELVLVFQNGNVVRIPISDILTGIATEDWVRQYFVAKENGKGLSTNDYTNEDKSKLGGIEAGAEVNVQSDWNENDSSKDEFIKNKPYIPTKTSDLQNDSGFIDNTYHDSTKQDVIDSSHKLNSDLVDDDNATHKFVSQEEKTQITTNKNDIAGIKDGTNIDSFSDVETALDNGKNYTNNIYSLATNNIAGKDTSTNILAKSSDTGIWIGTDTGHWYYWNGSQYVNGGVYQATQIGDGSVTISKLGSDVIDEFNDINEDIDSITVIGLNKFDKRKVTDGFYIDPSNGNPLASSGNSISEFIPIEATKYAFNDIFTGAFYDENKTFISGSGTPNMASYTGVTLPTTYKYVRFTVQNQKLDTAQMEEGSVATGYKPYEKLIKTDALITDEVRNKLNGPVKYTILKVGNAVDAFADSITSANNAITDSSYLNQYILLLLKGTYNEKDIYLKPYVHIKGVDRDGCIIKGELPASATDQEINPCSTLNLIYSNNLENITVTCKNMRYAVHDDGGGTDKVRNVKNCKFIHYGNDEVRQYRIDNDLPAGDVWASENAYGSGVNSGDVAHFDDCLFIGTVNGWGTHNNTNYEKSAYIEHNNCVFIVSNFDYAIGIASMGSGNIDTVVFNGCYANKPIKYFTMGTYIQTLEKKSEFAIKGHSNVMSMVNLIENDNYEPEFYDRDTNKIILYSANGTKYSISISNEGNLIITP